MKVTEPIDVFIADKLFQLTCQRLPAPWTGRRYRAALEGRTVVVFGGSYGIGADIAALASEYGAEVFTFSRSRHRHPRRAARRHRRGSARRSSRSPDRSTTSSIRPVC